MNFQTVPLIEMLLLSAAPTQGSPHFHFRHKCNGTSRFIAFSDFPILPGGDELVGVGGEGVHPLGDEGEVGEEQGGGAGEQQHHGQVVGEQHQGGGGADEQEEKEGENPG